jgi:diguanylate cyclase (GGDEF)-like protein
MPDLALANATDDVAETRRLEALYNRGVLDTEPEESFDRITRLAKTVLQTEMVTVSLLDGGQPWFRFRTNRRPADLGQSLATAAGVSDEPVLVQDTMADPRFAKHPLVTGAPWVRFYLGVPLRTHDGYLIGTLCAMDPIPHQPTEDHVALMQDLARLVVDELELRQLATTDGLTGALTRRAFLSEATRAIVRADRFEHDLSIIIFDIDHFKGINDRFGHPVGDVVLRIVAAVCKAELRRVDEFGRIGGEEFAIMLPQAGRDAALGLAERLRKAIAATRIPGPTGTISVTASFGIAGREWREDLNTLMTEADEALYVAKRSGRNQSMAAGRSPLTPSERITRHFSA